MASDADTQALARRDRQLQIENSIIQNITIVQATGIYKNRHLVEEVRSALKELKLALAYVDDLELNEVVNQFHCCLDPNYPGQTIRHRVEVLQCKLNTSLDNLRAGLAANSVSFDQIYPGRIPEEDLQSLHQRTRISAVEDRLVFWEKLLSSAESEMFLNGYSYLLD